MVKIYGVREKGEEQYNVTTSEREFHNLIDHYEINSLSQLVRLDVIILKLENTSYEELVKQLKDL